MNWIIIVAIVIVAFVSLLSISHIRFCMLMKKKGGAETVFRPLIDEMLKYDSGQILESKATNVTISGSFKDSSLLRGGNSLSFLYEKEIWTLYIQQNFKLISIFYIVERPCEGGYKKFKWEFSTDDDINDIVKFIDTAVSDINDKYGILIE